MSPAPQSAEAALLCVLEESWMPLWDKSDGRWRLLFHQGTPPDRAESDSPSGGQVP